MVKADVDKDYYADLEINATADSNEIKKAFKKLALKYHPDRNPGHELEYNSKFQAIQSANEILTDPVQRAKYDAQRIRSGKLHTYAGTSPPPSSRPPVPPRNPAPGSSNFPPPPRPPPFSQSKTTHPASSSGAPKYTRYNRPETAIPRSDAAEAREPKARNSDYKAWEQMRPRHGQGPIPNGGTVPPKASRASTFQAGNEAFDATPAGASRRQSQWNHFKDSQAGMPGMARSTTGRGSPTRPKFAPRTPGGDEPQAQGSAYFKVSRDERSAGSKQTHMPPPPSPAPTAKKPDMPPPPPFRDHRNLNQPFGKKKSRISTENPGVHMNGVDMTSPPGAGLHRSATSAVPRNSNSRTDFYERDAVSHVRAASATAKHHSTSPPKTKSSKLPGMYSSSSATSSEDETPKNPTKVYTAPPNTAQPRVPPSGQTRRGFNLYANVGDERPAPQARPGSGYNEIRRHSAVDLSTSKMPEGFQEHRMKHDAERSQQQSTNEGTATGSPAQDSLHPSLARSRSWQEKYQQDHSERSSTLSKETEARPSEGEQATKTPMYDSQGYTPFSSPLNNGPLPSGPPSPDKWSNQWPFNSPKRPRAPTAESPPHWAIPSSLPPPRKTDSPKKANTQAPLRYNMQGLKIADVDTLFSFKMPQYVNNTRTPTGQPSLRSQSSSRIDTKFSPDDWHGKFFEPPASHSATPLRTVSPPETNGTQQSSNQNTEEDARYMQTNIVPPPPPSGQDGYHGDRWKAHFTGVNFNAPQSSQPISPVRPTTRRRGRARAPKFAFAQPTVADISDEPTAKGAAQNVTFDNLESGQSNTGGDPMDIDELTPPRSVSDGSSNVDKSSEIRANGGVPPPPRAPTLPPRINEPKQAASNAPHLNLGDLKGVYPLAPSDEGLGNMNEIALNLPFKSGASSNKPVMDESLPEERLPDPPVCPSAPLSLTASSCNRFGQQLHLYMKEWYNFTLKMTDILATRQTFNRDNSGFVLMCVEDTGYDDYMKGLEHSRRARAHLDVAADRHFKTMQDLGNLRQEMRRGRGGVPA